MSLELLNRLKSFKKSMRAECSACHREGEEEIMGTKSGNYEGRLGG